MKKISLLMAASILMSSIQSGIIKADDKPTPIQSGSPAPYTGYEIPKETVVKIRDLSIDNDTNKHLNDNLTQENSLLNQRLTNAQTQNESLSKQLVDTKETGVFAKIGMFVLGAGITGLVSYGIYKSK